MRILTRKKQNDIIFKLIMIQRMFDSLRDLIQFESTDKECELIEWFMNNACEIAHAVSGVKGMKDLEKHGIWREPLPKEVKKDGRSRGNR